MSLIGKALWQSCQRNSLEYHYSKSICMTTLRNHEVQCHGWRMWLIMRWNDLSCSAAQQKVSCFLWISRVITQIFCIIGWLLRTYFNLGISHSKFCWIHSHTFATMWETFSLTIPKISTKFYFSIQLSNQKEISSYVPNNAFSYQIPTL